MKSFQPVPDASRLLEQAERNLVERGCDPEKVRRLRRNATEMARGITRRPPEKPVTRGG
jgi:hypothetical protein